jgi:hypothetical protein
MEHRNLVWCLLLVVWVPQENASLTFRMESVPFSHRSGTFEKIVLEIVRHSKADGTKFYLHFSRMVISYVSCQGIDLTKVSRN